ncbi:MAG: hypothetical protein E7F56_01930 [Limosilactobacillus fermentum]|nr:hypothetical protein [Limosilactobacillus fermentum]
MFSMFTDAEREDYIFHKLIRFAGKYGEEVDADRFDEIVKTLMSYDLTHRNQSDNGRFLKENGIRRGGVYFCGKFIFRIGLRRKKYGGGVGIICTDGKRFRTFDIFVKRWEKHKEITTTKPPHLKWVKFENLTVENLPKRAQLSQYDTNDGRLTAIFRGETIIAVHHDEKGLTVFADRN